MYGDASLVLSTDLTSNNKLGRAPQQEVYQQAISDLKTAKSLLSPAYKGGFGVTTTSARVRPNKFAAGAFLAKTYLYTGDWAEAEADSVINNADYQLAALNQVFLANNVVNKEAIWQLATTSTNNN